MALGDVRVRICGVVSLPSGRLTPCAVVFVLCFRFALQSLRAALADADRCIDTDPRWSKGYFRRACALRGLNRIADAKVAIQQALEVDAESAQFRAMQESLEKLNEDDFVPEPEESETGGDRVRWLVAC